MTVYELLDIALAIGNRIDMQWGLLITVHMAIYGGIVYIDRPLRIAEKIGGVTIYTLFMILNYRIMRLQMDFLQNSFGEISKLSSHDCCKENQLVGYIIADVASGRFLLSDLILAGGHVLLSVLVVVSIVFNHSIFSRWNNPPV